MNTELEITNEEIIKLIGEEGNIKISQLVEKTKSNILSIIKIIGELEGLGILTYVNLDSENIENSDVEVSKSYLNEFNLSIHNQTLLTKSRIESERKEKGYIKFSEYGFNKLKESFFDIFKGYEDISTLNDLEFSFVDRNKFNSDICIKIPTLLQKYSKGGLYIKEKVPELIQILNNSNLVENGIIKKIEAVGIYINITLGDTYLFNSIDEINKLGNHYGESDIYEGKSIVVDYSSPNTAKHLHAGHIRSTIIGHVLSNLYDATGYYTHRVNHINDWGGFGQLINGYEKWKEILPKFDLENDMLFFIYTMYRKGEKIAGSIDEYEKLSEYDIGELNNYYGEFSDYDEFVQLFERFINDSKESFSLLEKGNKNEVELWEQMVKWSMKDFDRFYNMLGIKQDYSIGESFYSNMGRNLVKRLEDKDIVVFYNSELAQNDIAKLKLQLDEGNLEEVEFYSIKNEILNDVGCYVVSLPNFERFVVLKADNSTIYATRDLAAIDYRKKVFSPSRMVYEVGQEQAEHFDKLFKSSKESGIGDVEFSHIYHGFYIDLDTKKKLSSRDGASNVQKLMQDSVEYFKKKYNDDNRGFSDNEIDNISHKLAIGSIVFNDIKKDKKNPVAISSDIEKTCKTFEESGGAYITYSICRANSILRKAGENINFDSGENIKLEGIEKTIINQLNEYPLIVLQASKKDNPAILTEYLFTLSKNYNSYYNSCPVLKNGNEYRLVITKSIIQVLTNGMKLCHIDIPYKI